MKNIISGLDEAFNHRTRLGIMAILAVNDWVDFNTLKDLLDLADGTLASHLKGLENVKIADNESVPYIHYKKEFVGKKPKTSYQCTPQGKEAFQKHLLALEQLIQMPAVEK
jgi:DNA-binding HxlR family transcriptional regulator